MYRTIDAAFWTDPKLRQLQPTSRLLFLYFITNPHTHVSGIYYMPDLIIQHETGLSSAVIATARDTLSRLGICRFDPANEVVWVVNMMKFQGRGEKNTLSAARHIDEDLHNSSLVNAFRKHYPAVDARCKNRVSEFGTPDPRSRSLNSEQEQEQEQDYPAAEKRAGRLDAAAELFKASYLENIGNPYGWLDGDFPQIAKLRKRLGIPTDATPLDWEQGLLNYFGTAFSEYTLKHFASKFDTFKNSSLDRYKIPTNHKGNGNGKQTQSDKVTAAVEEQRRIIREKFPDQDPNIAWADDGTGTNLNLRRTIK